MRSGTVSQKKNQFTDFLQYNRLFKSLFSTSLFRFKNYVHIISGLSSKFALLLLCGTLALAGPQTNDFSAEQCAELAAMLGPTNLPPGCGKPSVIPRTTAKPATPAPPTNYCRTDLDCRSYHNKVAQYCNVYTHKCDYSVGCKSFNDCKIGEYCNSVLNHCVKLS